MLRPDMCYAQADRLVAGRVVHNLSIDLPISLPIRMS